MKKPRMPTLDEIRLWRAATQHDETYAAQPPLPPDAQEPPLPSALAAPSPAAQSATPPPRPASFSLPPLHVLTGREATRLLKPYAPVEATLDLHGMGRVQAYGAVQDCIARARAAGKRHVLIITGKGRLGEGILRTQLPHWLNEPALRPQVVAIAQATPNKGGSGVYHVIVKRLR